MQPNPFTRPTIIAAVEVLAQHNHAPFDLMVLRLGLEEEIPSGNALYVAAKCARLAGIVLQRPTENYRRFLVTA